MERQKQNPFHFTPQLSWWLILFDDKNLDTNCWLIRYKLLMSEAYMYSTTAEPQGFESLNFGIGFAKRYY